MAAHQALPSLGLSRQEHWSGLPLPSPMHESEKWKGSRSVVSDSATPWTAAYQAPPSMGFSRQEYWSGVPLPSPEYSWLISFRINGLDLFVVQGTQKSLLQHHSSKASILWRSAFFIVQLSYPYRTTGKTIALTRWTFVGKVMSLLLNLLSKLVITFLPKSKCLLISWLQSPSAVILEPRKNEVSHCFHCFPIYLPWSVGTGCHNISFLNVEL